MHILKKERLSKAGETAVRCIFLGYDENRENGYLFLNIHEMKVFSSRDALFLENQFTVGRHLFRAYAPSVQSIKGGGNENNSISWNAPFTEDIHVPIQQHANNPPVEEDALDEKNQDHERLQHPAHDEPNNVQAAPHPPPREVIEIDSDNEREIIPQVKSGVSGRPRRMVRPPERYGNMLPSNLCYSTEEFHLVEEGPSTFAEAMQRPDAEEWRKACHTELKAHLTNHSWDLERRNGEMHVLPGRWVFVVKIDAASGKRKYKARFVVKGFYQLSGVDYDENEVSSSVLGSRSLRIILVIVVKEGYEIHQMDAISAFTQSELPNAIYAEQPKGFEISGMVCKLNKAVYGLKQASFLWQRDVSVWMKENGWSRCVLDENVYFKTSKTGRLVLVGLYVDDINGFYHPADREEYMSFVTLLKLRFTLKDLGEPQSILGMRIEYDKKRKVIRVNHQQYIEQLLGKYKMEKSNPQSTPENEELLGPEDCPTMESQRIEMQQYPYRKLVGELLYLACTTRPDLSHSVGVLSRFVENPGKKHWEACKRVLRYLAGTRDVGLTFNGNCEEGYHIDAYSDADWGRDLSNVKDQVNHISQCFKYLQV